MSKLIAFFGKQEIKAKYLGNAIKHQQLDSLVQGWGYFHEDNSGKIKGCAVGCSLEQGASSVGIHREYELQMGIPRILARLEDGIFETLPNERAMKWPVEFLSAIPVGADLNNIWPQFATWLLVDEKYGVLQFAKTDEQRKAINRIADMYRDPEKHSIQDWRNAAAAADAAAYAAADAAAAYAYAAADAAAAYAYAAAAYADDAYADAAAAYAYAAADAAAAYAYAAKRDEWREAQADKLLELMAAAPIAEAVA